MLSMVIDDWKQRRSTGLKTSRQVAFLVPLTQEADVTPQLHRCDRSALSAFSSYPSFAHSLLLFQTSANEGG